MSNTANSCNIMAKWFLLIVVCCSVCPPHSTHSTPIKARSGTASHAPTHHKSSPQQQQPCPHESIGELIRSSPVILKALGARIFTDDDLNAFQRQQQLQQQHQQLQQGQSKNAESNFVAARVDGDAATMANVMTTPSPAESILITLTPETIYKGASLLKVTPNAGGDAARSGAFAYSDAEAAYQYEGQLNATLQPFACFDNNVVKLLPSVLIAFGKLVTVQQQQHRQLFEPQAPQQQQQDVLHISINGLHRWSPQFEAHIWKHLGWDDWSDFTLCSVTCGKGVQQRFRRCLLDNPMMNLNMNMNFNNNDDDDAIVDEVETDGDNIDDEIAQHVDENAAVVNDWQQLQQQQKQSMQASQIGNANSGKNTPAGDEDISINGMNGIELRGGHPSAPAAAEDNVRGHDSNWRGAMAITANHPLIAHDVESVEGVDESLAAPTASSTPPAVAGIHNNRLQQDLNASGNLSPNEADGEDGEHGEDLVMGISEDRVRTHRNRGNVDAQAKRKRKHRKAAKTLSTLFCEGYNIEQRNCNTFECSDDISDLLKFYKRLPSPFEDSLASFSSQSPLPSSLQPVNSSPPDDKANSGPPYNDAGERRLATSPVSFSSAPSVSSSGAGVLAANTTSSNILFMASSSLSSSTTPSNMGFIKFWHNSLNFTLMLTLRAKNDSRKASATIFSIRNATHNLYLESCEDGLRLYLERDNSTEMLPVKFNLFDYRWHQVAISIQNGDFISIYVDCSWTNSFVVSKRLFSLPLDADVEIGRGFNGELQQILVLPDNQERHQCSSKRTSINEVKRYIIDTFIGDYTN